MQEERNSGGTTFAELGLSQTVVSALIQSGYDNQLNCSGI